MTPPSQHDAPAPRWVSAVRRQRQVGVDAAIMRERVAAALFPEERTPPRVGRYIVLERVGVGGMGVVHAAYDPELDRKVAIKLLRGRAQEGLLREARALARLSHPHVVSVHDVGTCQFAGESLMFVAMELVAGVTLTKWLQERQRSWRDVLDLLLEAGRGLAAAHAVGIVHGDFKPDNVLVDHGGHSHVVDFGLSRALVDDEQMDGGTLGYIAPEQLAGGATDARIDQFSYCVTLWEAVYGERPFEGATFRWRPSPRASTVPRWLRATLERGLAASPDKRWPTLVALLTALERGRARRGRLRGTAVVAVMTLAAGGVEALQQLDEQRRIVTCERAGDAIDEVWNDDARQSVRESLIATGAGHAATTADKLMPWLDAQANAWKEARSEACIDATVRDEWDSVVLDRAEWCLEDRRLEMAALVSQLQQVEANAVGRTVQAVASLRDVEPCRDTAMLERVPAPPTETRGEIEAIRTELSHARALQATTEYETGLEIATRSSEKAEALGWPPLIAAARLRVGELLRTLGKHEEAERVLESAYFEAAGAGAQEDAFLAAFALAGLVGHDMARYRDGERWAKIANLVREDLPDPGSLHEADIVNILALLEEAKGDYAEAAKGYERSLALRERAVGPDHPLVADMLDNLGIARMELGDFEAAESLELRAIEVNRRAYGADHPNVAMSLGNLSVVRHAMGDYASAKALNEEALAIEEKAFGPEHPRVAGRIDNLATMLRVMGSLEEARPLQQRALEISERSLGADHPQVAAIAVNVCGTLYDMGAHEQAIPFCERALRIYEAKLGPDHYDVGLVLVVLGATYTAMGNYASADAVLERSIRIYEQTMGPAHPILATAICNLGLVREHVGKFEEAVELHERALAMQEELFGGEHHEIARTLHELSRARLALGDSAQAERLQRRALAIWEKAGHPHVSHGLVALVRVAIVEGRWDEARAQAERAVQLRAAGPPHERAEAWFVLARSLQGGHEAVALAEQARDAYRESTSAHRDELAEVEAWLREHE